MNDHDKLIRRTALAVAASVMLNADSEILRAQIAAERLVGPVSPFWKVALENLQARSILVLAELTECKRLLLCKDSRTGMQTGGYVIPPPATADPFAVLRTELANYPTTGGGA